MAEALVDRDTALVDTVTPATAGGRGNGLRRAWRGESRRDKRGVGTAPRRRPVERRYRQTIRRIDLWSVVKISICFYLCALVVLLVAAMVLWWIATAFGAVKNVEDFIGTLIGSDDFELLTWRLLRGATLIGLVLVCIMVVTTVVGAAFYNLFSEILGGVEITVVEEE
ncbi:MAG: DUF3566 domain-containing protein [Acidimicrobiia bacterium]|nr:DUF3566 domain-containing protein [Acidimicrobiia bacterium]